MRDERWETRRRVHRERRLGRRGRDAEQAWGDEWGDAFKVDKGNRARLERAGRVVKHEVEGRVLVGAEAHRARLEPAPRAPPRPREPRRPRARVGRAGRARQPCARERKREDRKEPRF